MKNLFSNIILTLIYFFIFFPLGFLLKIIGKDFLEKKIDKSQNSYWDKKDNTDVDKIEVKMEKLLHPTKGFELTKVKIDNSFPKYILNNLSYYEKWIAK